MSSPAKFFFCRNETEFVVGEIQSRGKTIPLDGYGRCRPYPLTGVPGFPGAAESRAKKVVARTRQRTARNHVRDAKCKRFPAALRLKPKGAKPTQEDARRRVCSRQSVSLSFGNKLSAKAAPHPASLRRMGSCLGWGAVLSRFFPPRTKAGNRCTNQNRKKLLTDEGLTLLRAESTRDSKTENNLVVDSGPGTW